MLCIESVFEEFDALLILYEASNFLNLGISSSLMEASAFNIRMGQMDLFQFLELILKRSLTPFLPSKHLIMSNMQ